MRIKLLILLLLTSAGLHAQSTKPLGSLNAQDVNYIYGELQVAKDIKTNGRKVATQYYVDSAGNTYVHMGDSNTKYASHYAMDTMRARINAALASKQAALGFTPENVTNKAPDFSVVNNTKYPTTLATANYVALNHMLVYKDTSYVHGDTLYIFGDSWSAGSSNWSILLATMLGAPSKNLAAPGLGMMEALFRFYESGPPYLKANKKTEVISVIGFNDLRRNVLDVLLDRMWLENKRAFYTNCFLDSAWGMNSTAVTKSAGVNTFTSYTARNKGTHIPNASAGVLEMSNADSISFATTKTSVVVGYFVGYPYGDMYVYDSTAGYDYRIIDSIKGNENCLTDLTYDSYVYCAIKNYQLSNTGNHKIKIKPKPGDTHSVFGLDYIGTLASPDSCKAVIVGEVPYMVNTNYNLPNPSGYEFGSKERADRLNLIDRGLVSKEFDAYDIRFVNIMRKLDPLKDYNSDGIHPIAPPGHQKIADQFYEAMYKYLLKPEYFFSTIPYTNTPPVTAVAVQNTTSTTLSYPSNIAISSNGGLIYNSASGSTHKLLEIDSTVRAVRAMNFTQQSGTIVQSPTGTYTGDMGAYMMADDYIPQYTDGYVQSTISGLTGISILGLDHDPAFNRFDSPAWDYDAFAYNGEYWCAGNLFGATQTNTGVATANGDLMQLYRNTTGHVVFRKSSDGGSTWTTLFTSGLADPNKLYAKVGFSTGFSSNTIVNPVIYGKPDFSNLYNVILNKVTCTIFSFPNGIKLVTGNGSPEGVVPAAVGSTYYRADGGTGTSQYKKESGTGTTGWVAY